uniref:Uncharacterized protein n=1 Tax=Physcomitrium patens TaxID=3218 RepID=A0A2K1ILX9_PHYPA|nr:hypothetical protein PHYPA_026600 [Physcomitrium patens]
MAKKYIDSPKDCVRSCPYRSTCKSSNSWLALLRLADGNEALDRLPIWQILHTSLQAEM